MTRRQCQMMKRSPRKLCSPLSNGLPHSFSCTFPFFSRAANCSSCSLTHAHHSCTYSAYCRPAKVGQNRDGKDDETPIFLFNFPRELRLPLSGLNPYCRVHRVMSSDLAFLFHRFRRPSFPKVSQGLGAQVFRADWTRIREQSRRIWTTRRKLR